MSKFQDVERSVSFPKIEQKVMKFWKKVDAFKTSLKKSEGRPAYTFYDGPPFATGLPHYGHLLAGTIKDCVTRYAHQTGHHVERRFGWDCHGLPIEFAIEKKLGLKTKEQVLKFGIKRYNEECRKIVMKYASEWERIVGKLGRWIDFENDYKTMNLSFMESVWWVFGELWKKDLVYRGFKVMPYSTACTTPLSNFEVQQNYRMTSDPSVTITFPLEEDKDICFVAWTTTPWTLPSNLALCVKEDMDYVLIEDNFSKKKYILATCRLEFIYPKLKKKKKKKNKKLPYTVLKKYKGKDLVGKKYVPLFDYYVEEFTPNGGFTVVSDSYVTEDSGTGIVHQAAAYGEDDFRILMKWKIVKKGGGVACAVDDNGRFLPRCPDLKGMYIKDADKVIMDNIKKKGRMIKQESIVHNYPFCWRSDTPLIYKAVPSWFVKVEQIRDRIVNCNKQTYWVPSFVKEKRFHNWLGGARDWAISRTRYFGTPIPIWISDDGEEVVVISSVKQLEELTGEKVKDLHRENIDHLVIKSKKGKGNLKRIPDVFDCWFESGAMPYAQSHYPFENKKKFESTFPADFIAEGLDQTRGWFYTLMVLGTALFDKPPFKNVIVNGLVLAEDGKKMSKRLKNYPDPELLIDEFGADALRLYLINSPVVRAEPIKFSEKGVKEIIKLIFLPWYNAYRFFVQNSKRFFRKYGELFSSKDVEEMKISNIMDKWILSCSQSLVRYVKKEMEGYRLYTVIPKLLEFVDQLTNWYVRLGRSRLKGEDDKEDRKVALGTLYRVLMISIKTMAPFTPFLTEEMYSNLSKLIPEKEREESIHYTMFPKFNKSLVEEAIESAISKMQKVVVKGRKMRDQHKISMKFPVAEYIYLSMNEKDLDEVKKLEGYLKSELNTKKVSFSTDVKQYFKYSAKTKDKLLGRRLKRKLRSVKAEVAKMGHDDVIEFLNKGEVTILDEKLVLSELEIQASFIGDSKKWEDAVLLGDAGYLLMNVVLTNDLILEGNCRTLSSCVQQLRKKMELVVEDVVDVYFQFNKEVESKEKEAFGEKLPLVKSHLSGMNVEEVESKEEIKENLFAEERYPADEKEPWRYRVYFVKK